MYINPTTYWVLIGISILSCIQTAVLCLILLKFFLGSRKDKNCESKPIQEESPPIPITTDKILLAQTNVGSTKESYPPSSLILDLTLDDTPFSTGMLKLVETSPKIVYANPPMTSRLLEFITNKRKSGLRSRIRSLYVGDEALKNLIIQQVEDNVDDTCPLHNISQDDFNDSVSIYDNDPKKRIEILAGILLSYVMENKTIFTIHRPEFNHLDPYSKLVSHKLIGADTILSNYLQAFVRGINGYNTAMRFSATSWSGAILDQLINIQKTIWVHHTSNQFYRILGFILDHRKVICVVYVNTRNYALYHRPADDWLRSMTPHTFNECRDFGNGKY